eukprot:g1389.t1
MKALGAASEENMEELMEAGAQQEQQAMGAAAARKLTGTLYFLGEALDLLRGFFKETGKCVILPSPTPWNANDMPLTLQRLMSAVGLEGRHFFMHSFRVGGAVNQSLAGTTFDVLMDFVG